MLKNLDQLTRKYLKKGIIPFLILIIPFVLTVLGMSFDTDDNNGEFLFVDFLVCVLYFASIPVSLVLALVLYVVQTKRYLNNSKGTEIKKTEKVCAVAFVNLPFVVALLILCLSKTLGLSFELFEGVLSWIFE